MLQLTGTIRDASAGEWEAIRNLLIGAALPVHDLHDAAGFKVYVADGRLAGAIALEPCGPAQAMLRSLAVHPDARGRGIGAALVRSLEAAAESDGLAEIFLLTTSAGPFFARLDYRPLARDLAPDSVTKHEQYRTLCPASAVLMHKRLQR